MTSNISAEVTESSIVLGILPRSERRQVAAILTEAFQDDLGIRYIFRSRNVQDRWLRILHGIWFDVAYSTGIVCGAWNTSADPKVQRELVGVALWSLDTYGAIPLGQWCNAMAQFGAFLCWRWPTATR